MKQHYDNAYLDQLLDIMKWRPHPPFLKDLVKLSGWLVVVGLLICACGSFANAKPYHRGHHAYQSHRHQHEARSSDARRVGHAEASSDHSWFDRLTGAASGGALVAEARSQIGNGAIYGRASLWCARFMNWVLAHTGHHGTGSDAAASFAHYGRRVTGPQPGAIAVMSRRGGGHVGVVSGVDGNGNPIVISGNSRGKVREAAYARGRVYAYVVPN